MFAVVGEPLVVCGNRWEMAELGMIGLSRSWKIEGKDIPLILSKIRRGLHLNHCWSFVGKCSDQRWPNYFVLLGIFLINFNFSYKFVSNNNEFQTQFYELYGSLKYVKKKCTP